MCIRDRGRQCSELKRLLKKEDSEVKTGTVNHFRIIWHKDAVLNLASLEYVMHICDGMCM